MNTGVPRVKSNARKKAEEQNAINVFKLMGIDQKRCIDLTHTIDTAYDVSDDGLLCQLGADEYDQDTGLISHVQREELPLSNVANHLAQAYLNYENLIIIGETGCGKSTQIPQVLMELMETAKLPSQRKVIAITEPRRIAAMTLAIRVQEELKTSKIKCARVPGFVGHQVRFSDSTTKNTKICYMTEATLLRSCYVHPWFPEYDLVIVDEAHERSLNLDALMGALKAAQIYRRTTPFEDPITGKMMLQPLKLIVMTATGDIQKFEEFLPSSQVLLVTGKKHPVIVKYSTIDIVDYYSATTSLLIRLHQNLPVDMHILVFLTGQEEIECLVETLKYMDGPYQVMICPLYAALPPSAQCKAYMMPREGTRKIVIATNIAETSLTIPGIRCVMDCGYAKYSYHVGKTAVETFKIDRISKSEANQRAGRAGREKEGCVFRIYKKEDYDALAEYHTPAVRVADLSSLFMMIPYLHQAHWNKNVLDFPFIERPHDSTIQETFNNLRALGIITGKGFGQGQYTFTDNAHRLAAIPLPPHLARVLLTSPNYGCMPEICASLSLVDCDHVYACTGEERKRVELSKYAAIEGDLITFSNIMQHFGKEKDRKQWCETVGLNYRSVLYAEQVRKQLLDTMKHLGLKDARYVNSSREELQQSMSRCYMDSMPFNMAYLSPDGSHYQISDGKGRAPLIAKIGFLSFLAMFRPPRLFFTNLTLNARNELLMRNCLAIIDLNYGKLIDDLILDAMAYEAQQLPMIPTTTNQTVQTQQPTQRKGKNKGKKKF